MRLGLVDTHQLQCGFEPGTFSTILFVLGLWLEFASRQSRVGLRGRGWRKCKLLERVLGLARRGSKTERAEVERKASFRLVVSGARASSVGKGITRLDDLSSTGATGSGEAIISLVPLTRVLTGRAALLGGAGAGAISGRGSPCIILTTSDRFPRPEVDRPIRLVL